MTVRCPVCRTRRATWLSMLMHQVAQGHRGPCDCGHGCHYPHRPGSVGCQSAPWDELFNEPREGRLDPPSAPIPF